MLKKIIAIISLGLATSVSHATIVDELAVQIEQGATKDQLVKTLMKAVEESSPEEVAAELLSVSSQNTIQNIDTKKKTYYILAAVAGTGLVILVAYYGWQWYAKVAAQSNASQTAGADKEVNGFAGDCSNVENGNTQQVGAVQPLESDDASEVLTFIQEEQNPFKTPETAPRIKPSGKDTKPEKRTKKYRGIDTCSEIDTSNILPFDYHDLGGKGHTERRRSNQGSAITTQSCPGRVGCVGCVGCSNPKK